MIANAVIVPPVAVSASPVSSADIPNAFSQLLSAILSGVPVRISVVRMMLAVTVSAARTAGIAVY